LSGSETDSSGGSARASRWQTADGEVRFALAAMRLTMSRLGEIRPVGLLSRHADLNGVACEWVWAPASADSAAVTLYLHGGGFVAGSPASHFDLAARLSAASRSRVLLPDYRLAPDHAYPAQLDDALAVYRALLDSGVAPGRLAVAGDSAGGNLALALVLRARELGLALPAALVCYSPWTDLTHAGASIRANAELDQAIPVKMLGPLAAMYCGGRDPRDPLISPLFAGHHRFPPTQLHVAADEVLRDDTLRLVRQLTASGVEVEHRIWADVPHAFPVFAATLAQGRAAIRDSGEFLLRHFESAA
jgi:acetyl esterase/lipase